MRMKLPEIKAPVAPAPTEGLMLFGSAVPLEETAPVGMTATDDISDLKPAIVEAPQQPQELSPALSSDNIARLEELSRSIVEVRALVVAAQQSVQMQSQAIAGLQQQVQQLQQMHLQQIESLRQMVAGLNDDTVRRLKSIDTVLQSRGLPTSQQSATIKLTQMRRLVYPAKIVDGAVVLYYNPRQGENGMVDNQDFQLTRDVVRHVWCGYRIEIPVGYIADIFVGNDLISSLSGRRDAEEMLKLRTNGTSINVSSGREIARLLLRKIEPAELQIEVQA